MHTHTHALVFQLQRDDSGVNLLTGSPSDAVLAEVVPPPFRPISMSSWADTESDYGLC